MTLLLSIYLKAKKYYTNVKFWSSGVHGALHGAPQKLYEAP
jgi:hypothetical protein